MSKPNVVHLNGFSKWICHVNQISLFSLLIPAASFNESTTMNNAKPYSGFLICTKQCVNQALRRECLVRICVCVRVGKCTLSWISFVDVHLKCS